MLLCKKTFLGEQEKALQVPSGQKVRGKHTPCILKQMKETFETNLSSSQKEEMANQKAYEELKAAKEMKFCLIGRETERFLPGGRVFCRFF